MNSYCLTIQIEAAKRWTMWEMLTAHLIQNHDTIKRGEDDKFSLASTFTTIKPLFSTALLFQQQFSIHYFIITIGQPAFFFFFEVFALVSFSYRIFQ
jgi:proline iminopeptidase